MKNKENKSFNYIYSAKEQAEIRAIRKKYIAPKENEDKMEELRRMDSTVTQKATTVSLVLGIIGALILGTGMSLAITDIGKALGSVLAMTLGILIGLIGTVIVCSSYPVYNHILKREREKIAPEIIRLTDELLK